MLLPYAYGATRIYINLEVSYYYIYLLSFPPTPPKVSIVINSRIVVNFAVDKAAISFIGSDY